jgi:hypothetical protein
MQHSIRHGLIDAIAKLPEELLQMLTPKISGFSDLVHQFGQQAPTPVTTCQFEKQLADHLREFGRVTLQFVFNHLEPAAPEDAAARVHFGGETYRRKPKSQNTVDTLFGPVQIWRFLYEPLEGGLRSIHPLELQLGIEAGAATPALAERVGLWSAEHDQDRVLQLLSSEHQVRWRPKKLRRVQCSLRDGLASFREDAQVRRLRGLLKKAFCSKGRYRPALAVGRDGIHLPVRPKGYREGATATVSVHDRRGKRLGTVYLGQMPEAGQLTLSQQLTALVKQVLTDWKGDLPRLAYITDGGFHPEDYYQNVLKKMCDPRHPGRRLEWLWVLDYYHAVGYLRRLSEALFVTAEKGKGWEWFRRTRRWLRDRHQGVTEVLRSATQYWNRQKRASLARQEEFWTCYEYLRRHTPWMAYSRYRRQGLPIGSGVTEAACKTVFAQRLKRSGMTWGVEGGQVIVDLRVLFLSEVWEEAHGAYLRSRELPMALPGGSQAGRSKQTLKKAA